VKVFGSAVNTVHKDVHVKTIQHCHIGIDLVNQASPKYEDSGRLRNVAVSLDV
jgi:hypothetical protein